MNFGAGSPDITPSKTYLDKLKELISENGMHLYPGYTAIPEFSNALIHWYWKRFGVALTEDELLPLLGAKDGVSHIALAILDEGDEILVPDPGYPGFSGPALIVGARPVFYDLAPENNFRVNINELENKVSSKTKAIWVNFPSNPTGQVATIKELLPIVEFAHKHCVTLIYDNAYSEITFGGFKAPSVLAIAGAKGIAVEIGSFSKTFSFAGYRMGWITGNKDVIAALAKIKSQMDSGLSLPLQKLGAFALDDTDQNWQQTMLNTYQSRRDIIAAKLQKLGLSFEIPKGSLYLWARIPQSCSNSDEFCNWLLQDKQVLVTPGTVFGKNGERYIRVSFCVNVDRINEYLS